MAPLKEKNPNIVPNASPNTSRKRKSGTTPAEQPSTKAPAPKRARKVGPAKSKARTTTAVEHRPSSSPEIIPDSQPEPTPAPAAKPKTTKKAPARTSESDDKYDISSVTIPGEENASVPVYDTCADIRTKINKHFRTAPTPYSSQAALVRAIKAQYPAGFEPDEGLSARSLKTFMGRQGPNGGASMPIFYGAYVYFEKLRIRQNKKKTKKREEMEAEWGPAGMDLADDSAQPRLMQRNERLEVDKYGRMNIVSVGGM